MRSMVEGARARTGLALAGWQRGSTTGHSPSLAPSTAFGGPPPPLRGGGS
jgi:hypothetical protein